MPHFRDPEMTTVFHSLFVVLILSGNFLKITSGGGGKCLLLRVNRSNYRGLVCCYSYFDTVCYLCVHLFLEGPGTEGHSFVDISSQ